MNASFEKIKEALSKAQENHKQVATKHRRHLAFKEDDWVLLKFTKTHLSHTTGKNKQKQPIGHQKFYVKLAKHYYAPFQILKQINKIVYKLKLPSSWHIHNVFHVSLLKPYKGKPPSHPIQEEPPKFDEKKEILQPGEIIRHEDDILFEW